MAIVRWEPFREMIALQDRMNRLFDPSMVSYRNEEPLKAWAPSVDIYETEKEIVLKADLPEVKLDDVDLSDSTIAHAVVRFIGNNVRLHNVRFVDCYFLIALPSSPTPAV